MKPKKIAVYYLAEDGFMHLGHFERKKEAQPSREKAKPT
jgi:hypothetical protein